MKKKIKNTIFSLLVAIALLLSGNFTLAFTAVNSLKQSSFAEYKPTDFVSPYEFSSNTGWSKKPVDDNTIKQTFSANISTNLTSLTKFKPNANYKGDLTSVESGTISDYGVMSITTDSTPVKTEVEKTKDGKVVFKTNPDGSYVYVLDDKTGEPKEHPSNSGDTNRFVLKDGTTNVYYEKEAEMEEINVYYYFQTNNSLSLKANSWYVVGAYVCTFDADASIMVSGTKFEKEVKVPNTNGKWQLVYLFLETSSDSTNSVNLRFYYGSSDGISTATEKDATETGAVYLDHVTVQTISQTEYLLNTINGEEVEGKVTNDLTNLVDTYSARYDFDQTINKINNKFETGLTDNGDGTFKFNLYEKLYGTNDYDDESTELANNYYQYYINKYTADDGKEKLTDKQLGLWHKAYNEKLKTSVVLESKEFETEEEVKDEQGNPVLDGNQKPTTKIVPAPSTFNLNNHVLKLENKSEKYSLGILSAPIEVDQFGYYKLTLFARGLSEEDSATVKLISFIKTGTSSEDGAMQVKSQTVSPYTEKSDNTNNWTEISFYIQGSSYYNTTFQIALLADKESTIYYDQIRLESITSTTYSNATSSKQFNLFPSSTAITSSITNGTFDSIKTEDVNPNDIKKPYLPNSWTKLDKSSEDVVAGIVSSKTDFYSVQTNSDGKTVQQLLGGAENPIRDYELNGKIISPARTNFLAIYAPKTVDGKETTHDYGYKSNSISLSSNSAYKITVQVYYVGNTQDSNFSGNMYLNLIASDENIAEFNTTVTEAETEIKGNWITYTFAVHTGSASRTVYLKLGVTEATGTVFFQKVNYKKLAEKTVDEEKISVDTQFNEIVSEVNTIEKQDAKRMKVVSFEKDPFIMHSEDKVKDKDYYQSLSHSLRTAEDDKDTKEDESIIEQGEMGVVDLTESDGLTLNQNLTLESSFLSNPKGSSSFAMFIHNSSNYFTQVSPRNEISLSSSSYYEISLYVKTKDIAEGNSFKVYLDKISVTFNVNTEHDNYGDLTESNGYKKLTAFVKTGSSTISGLKIVYELGSTQNKFTGTALVSNLSVTKLADEEAYNELVKDVNSSDKTTVIKNFKVEAEHDHDHEDADNLTLATFFLVFSSILLVAALVFALVSISIKRNLRTTGSSAKSAKKDTDAPKDGFI